jgi:hypothetical protein
MLVRRDLTVPARETSLDAAPSFIQSIPPLSPLAAGFELIALGTGTGADLGTLSARVGALCGGGVAPPTGFTYNQLFTFPNGS